MIRRRFVLLAACAFVPPVLASSAEVAILIGQLVGDATLRDGRVRLDLPVMVENGNAVAMSVSAVSPMDEIHVFAEANPLPRVAVFRFGPRSGPPRVATRIRLATSQTVIAVARAPDGTFWRDTVDLLVTLAACIE